jgi:hypothetical protein
MMQMTAVSASCELAEQLLLLVLSSLIALEH